MKRFFLLLAVLVLCSGCSKGQTPGTEDPGTVTFRGLVVSKDKGALSVIVLDEGKSLSKFEPVQVRYDTSGLDVSMGDIVEIRFNGLIAESYPCQIGADTVRVRERVSDNWPATGSIPLTYTVKEAVADHCFVVAPDGVESKNLLENFISNAQAGILSFLRKVSYTDEGDPIITDVIFNGKKYYVFEDDTRDSFAGDNALVYKKEYLYINTLENKSYRLVYLADRKDMTAKEYEKAMASDNSKDSIDTYPLYLELAKNE